MPVPVAPKRILAPWWRIHP